LIQEQYFLHCKKKQNTFSLRPDVRLEIKRISAGRKRFGSGTSTGVKILVSRQH
jgi:hypothetical protein